MFPVMSALYVLDPSQWQAYVLRGTCLMVQRAEQNSPAANVLVSRWQVLDLWMLVADGTSGLDDGSDAKLSSFFDGR